MQNRNIGLPILITCRNLVAVVLIANILLPITLPFWVLILCASVIGICFLGITSIIAFNLHLNNNETKKRVAQNAQNRELYKDLWHKESTLSDAEKSKRKKYLFLLDHDSFLPPYGDEDKDENEAKKNLKIAYQIGLKYQTIPDKKTAQQLFSKFFTLLCYARVKCMLSLILARQAFFIFLFSLLIAGALLNLPILMAISILTALLPLPFLLHVISGFKLSKQYRGCNISSKLYNIESARINARIYYGIFTFLFCIAGSLIFLGLTFLTLKTAVAVTAVIILGILALQGLFIDTRKEKLVIVYDHFCDVGKLLLGQAPLFLNTLSISEAALLPERKEALGHSFDASPNNDNNDENSDSAINCPELFFVKIP